MFNPFRNLRNKRSPEYRAELERKRAAKQLLQAVEAYAGEIVSAARKEWENLREEGVRWDFYVSKGVYRLRSCEGDGKWVCFSESTMGRGRVANGADCLQFLELIQGGIIDRIRRRADAREATRLEYLAEYTRKEQQALQERLEKEAEEAQRQEQINLVATQKALKLLKELK